MKYLKSRDNYLQRLNQRREFLNEKRQEFLTENTAGSGVFGNEVRWGDSLLGRYIAHKTRHFLIAVDLGRVKGVVDKLKRALDDILIDSGLAQLTGDDKKLWGKVLVSEFLIALEEMVNNYGDPDFEPKIMIKDIQELTDSVISEVEKIEDLENKNELLRMLREWKKFIDKLKDVKENDEEKGSNKWQDDAKSNKSLEDKANSVFFENFKSVARLFLLMKKEVELKAANFKTNQASTAKKTSQVSAVGGSTPSTKPSNVVSNPGLISGAAKTNDSYISDYLFNLLLEADYNDAGEAISGVNPKANQTPKASEIEKALGVLYTTVKSNPDSFDDMNKIISLKVAGGSVASAIGQIYKQIRNKLGLKSVPEKANENVDEFLSRQSSSLAKQILAFYNVSKNKVDGSFPEIKSADIKKEIATFNTTMKACLSPDLYKIVDKKEEGVLLSYYSFLNSINEDIVDYNDAGEPITDKKDGDKKDGDKKDGGSLLVGPTRETLFTKIKDFWDKNVDFSQWVLEKSEIDKVRILLEKKMASNKDSIDIMNIDPVLDVVRCFNRAYKLHTTQVIPGNREGGVVSNIVFREYESFGGGTPENAAKSGGPYRNRKVFNEWEDSVLKLMGNRDYQKIFNIGTKLRVGDDYIEKAGANLRKFMNDLLDGDDLYKGGDGKGQGAQAKFLDKYFGYTGDASSVHFGTKAEAEEEAKSNGENSSNIKPVNLDGVIEKISYTEQKDLENTFFIISSSSHVYYCYIHLVENNKIYFSYSSTAYYILKCIKQDASRQYKIAKPDLFKTTIKNNESTEQDYAIKYSTVRFDLFVDKEGKTILPTSIDIRWVQNIENAFVTRPEDGEFERNQSTKVYQLVDLEKGKEVGDKKRLKVKPESIASVLKSEGISLDIKKVNGIESVGVKSA